MDGDVAFSRVEGIGSSAVAMRIGYQHHGEWQLFHPKQTFNRKLKVDQQPRRVFDRFLDATRKVTAFAPRR